MLSGPRSSCLIISRYQSMRRPRVFPLPLDGLLVYCGFTPFKYYMYFLVKPWKELELRFPGAAGIRCQPWKVFSPLLPERFWFSFVPILMLKTPHPLPPPPLQFARLLGWMQNQRKQHRDGVWTSKRIFLIFLTFPNFISDWKTMEPVFYLVSKHFEM